MAAVLSANDFLPGYADRTGEKREGGRDVLWWSSTFNEFWRALGYS